MDAIVLDIETIGSPSCESFLEPVTAPSNYRDEAKIAAYCAEKRQQQIERAGLEADLCEVVAIGFMPHGIAPCVYTREEFTERQLLDALWEAVATRFPLEPRPLIGFNILNFDLPVLIRRSQLLGVSYPSINLDRYRTPHIDLLERLSFNGKLTYRSLKFYAKRFGLPIVDNSDGADIAALVEKGDWAAVAAHCRADVELTAALAQRLGYLPQTQPEMVL